MTKDKRQKTNSRFEHSAGGVIYRKQKGKIQILLLRDKNNEWSFPKGLIEKGEELVKTAEREIEEEVGLQDLVYIDTIDSIGYFYRFAGSLIRKKVDFFLFRYDGQRDPKPLQKEGISDVQWFDPEKAHQIIGYAKTNKQILEKAIRIAHGLPSTDYSSSQ